MSNKLIQQINDLNNEIITTGLYEYNNELYNNTAIYKNVWTSELKAGDIIRTGIRVTIPDSVETFQTSACIIILDSLGQEIGLGVNNNGLTLYADHYTDTGEFFEINLPLKTTLGTAIWWKIISIAKEWPEEVIVEGYVPRSIETQTKNLNIAGEHFNSTKLNDIKENKAYGGYSLVTGRTSYAGIMACTIIGVEYKSLELNITQELKNLINNIIETEGKLKAIYNYYIGTTAYNGNCNLDTPSSDGVYYMMDDTFPAIGIPTNSQLGDEYQPDNFDNEVNIIFFPDHPELGNRPIGYASFSSGRSTIAARKNSHAEGNKSKAFGTHSHAEGESTETYGSASHAEGLETIAKGEASHASGYKTITNGNYSITSGYNTITLDSCSAAFGQNTEAGKFAMSIGNNNHATGEGSFSGGNLNYSTGKNSVSFGENNNASGKNSMALGGGNNQAQGDNSIALGYGGNIASGNGAIALGGISGTASMPNTASGTSSIAMGYNNEANGSLSLAGGSNCIASNSSTLAFGNGCQALGEQSAALGYYTTAQNITNYKYGQMAIGRNNKLDNEAVFIIGNAKAQGENNRSTAFSVQMDGSIKVQSEQILTLKITTASGDTTYKLLKVSEV